MKKLIITIIFSWAALTTITSCKKSVNPLFVGSWSRTYTNNLTAAVDTLYLKITDNSNFQFADAVGSGYTQLGTGTYTYNSNAITFVFQTSANGASVCVGTPGSYTYAIDGIALGLTLANDSCNAYSPVPRSALIAGSWTD